MTKEVAKTGRTGWYLRVITEGKIELGQSLELTEQPNPNWSVSRANDVLFGREVDRMATIELMSVKELSQSWKDDIA